LRCWPPSDVKTTKVFGDGLLALNDRISQIAKECRNTVRAEGAALFEPFARRLHQFHEFRRELVRCGVEVIPAAGREWGDNEANRNPPQGAQRRPRGAGRALFEAFAADLCGDRRRALPQAAAA
jgi:hypothetical protein